MTRNGGGSLRTKLLGVVLIGAVLPLVAIGWWLNTNAVRSGEALLRSQLEESLTRQADQVLSDWPHRKSDAMLLADNEPLRAALASGTTDPPPFLVSAFATMPALQSATYRDSTGRARFVLGDRPAEGIGRSSPDGVVALVPTIGLSVPVLDADGAHWGELEARVRASALFTVPREAGVDAAMYLAKDRSTGTWLMPPIAPEAILDQDRFSWNGQEWVAVRHILTDPPVELILASRLDPITAPFARNARAGTLALVVAAVLVILVTAAATLRITRSLAQLALAADAVAKGDLEQRLDSSANDEVGRVAHAFNTMTENLKRILREKSQGEALAAMGELAAVLAHQVRSPLTAMRIDLQRVEHRLSADDRELVTRAIQQLDRLERSVGGALRIAKSAAGTFESVDLLPPLGRAMQGVQAEVRARGGELVLTTVASDGLFIRGDSASLEQLFSNVLLNAAEATRSGGQISVKADRKNGHVTVLVEDTGTGMNAATLARVFEPYYTTKPDGTGIGLAVAHRIVTAHGGTIDLTSEQGRGTCVRVTFPAAGSGAP
jgi:signal transduction histidine kinase